MSRNFKSIEFFGIPGSGKTYCASIVREIFEKKGYTIFNARECIISGSKNLIKLDLIEKVALNYFRLLNFKKKKINNKINIKNNIKNIKLNSKYRVSYLKLKYQKICRKIILTKKNFRNIVKKLEEIFKDKTSLNQQYLFWIYELISSQIIFEKYYKHKSKNLLLLDEGLIQRSFTINKKIPKEKKKNFFKYYFSNVPISKSIFLISSSQKKIKEVNKKRKVNNISKYKKNDELKKFLEFLNLYLIKQKKFKFLEIKNDKKLTSNLISTFS